MKLLLQKKKLLPFFRINNINSIAIYGLGELGELLYTDLNKEGIDIKYCFDSDLARFHGMKVYSPQRIGKVADVDLIIVCLTKQSSNEALELLKIKSNIPFCTIGDIIDMSFYVQTVIPYLKELNCNPYITTFPYLNSLECLSGMEEILLELPPLDNASNPRYFKQIYKDVPEYNDNYIQKVFKLPPVINLDGVLKPVNINNEFVNLMEGSRLTTNTPNEYKQTIQIFGSCAAYGLGVDDKRTVASILQRKLNESAFKKYRVINRGLANYRTHNPSEIYNRIQNTEINKNDIVIMISDFKYSSAYNEKVFQYFCKYVESTGGYLYHFIDRYNAEHKKDLLYYNINHLSPAGLEVFADCIKGIVIDYEKKEEEA